MTDIGYNIELSHLGLTQAGKKKGKTYPQQKNFFFFYSF